VALRPDPPARLDGAWWPRSTQLATELPGLITGLSDRLGQIDLVGYHLGAWTATPPHLEIAGHTLELHGVSSDEPNSVILVGQGRHLALLVIPPDADEQAARQQLNATAERADGDVAAYQQVVREVAVRLASREGSDDPQRVEELRRCQVATVSRQCRGRAREGGTTRRRHRGGS